MDLSASRTNAVEDAVQAVGGPSEASHICHVSAATIYAWRKQGYVSDGLAAVKLAKASGIPVEDLVGFNQPMRPAEPPLSPTRPPLRGRKPARYPAEQHASRLAPVATLAA